MEHLVDIIRVKQAMNFVLHTGNPVTKAFARYAISRSGEDQMLDAITSYQFDDGGWAQMGAEDTYGFSLLTPTLAWYQWLIWMRPMG